jgi:hypothetical protein
VKDQITNSEVKRQHKRAIIGACALTVVACLLFLAASEEASAAFSTDPDYASCLVMRNMICSGPANVWPVRNVPWRRRVLSDPSTSMYVVVDKASTQTVAYHRRLAYRSGVSC